MVSRAEASRPVTRASESTRVSDMTRSSPGARQNLSGRRLDRGDRAAENAKRMTMKDRLPIVADLLMDAAFADQRLEGEEKDAVKRLLRELLETQALPMD